MQGQKVIDDLSALGTLWYVEVFDPIHTSEISALRDSVTELILTFQHTHSRFERCSLLNDLNYNKKVPFDEELYTLIDRGMQYTRDTDGVFSLMIKKALEQKGYGPVIDREDLLPAINTSLPLVYEKDGYIHLNSHEHIDLGGIGKGFLIDKLARVCREQGIHHVLINGGGDMYGTTLPDGSGIEVFLEHPTELEKYIGSFALRNQSLCVSSSYKRRWRHAGATHDHFVSDSSSNTLSTAYILAHSATVADVYATVACILADTPGRIDQLARTQRFEYMVMDSTQNWHATPLLRGALFTS